MRRRLSIRCTVMLAALAIVASAGGAIAAPTGGQSSSEPGASGNATTSPSTANQKPTRESARTRGSVDARALAETEPAKRPVGHLPNLGRQAAGKSTAPAAPGVATVVPPLPTQATLN